MNRITPSCPVCKSTEDFFEGEIVNVGFGPKCGPKSGPDSCNLCGYIEAGPNPNDYPLDYYVFCYENHIDPHEVAPCKKLKLIKKPLLPKYAEFIDQIIYEEAYGKCKDQSIRMMESFPNLKCVYGLYYDPYIGPREHFWLYDPTDENCVVDPTKIQFPSKGVFTYEVFYPINPHTLERLDRKEIELHLFEKTGKEFKFKLE